MGNSPGDGMPVSLPVAPGPPARWWGDSAVGTGSEGWAREGGGFRARASRASVPNELARPSQAFRRPCLS